MAAPKSKRTILALDDDDENLLILAKTIEDAGYEAKEFSSSELAWKYLNEHPKSIDIVVMDKMMPGIGGIELLSRIKRHAELKHVPVILQTGDVGMAQMQEGLAMGAYYYLTKPFTPEMLAALIKAAENECALFSELRSKAAAEQGRLVKLLEEAKFSIRTFAEARFLAAALSQTSAMPELTARGLMELLFNAIEHGNLEIGFQKKQSCLLNNMWAQEVAGRLSSPAYKPRLVKVVVRNGTSGMQLMITDQGKGFEWRDYLRGDTPKLDAPNGRGILIASRVLGGLQYSAKGNEVCCTLNDQRPIIQSTSGYIMAEAQSRQKTS